MPQRQTGSGPALNLVPMEPISVSPVFRLEDHAVGVPGLRVAGYFAEEEVWHGPRIEARNGSKEQIGPGSFSGRRTPKKTSKPFAGPAMAATPNRPAVCPVLFRAAPPQRDL